jgi:hypothetical protein
MACHGGRLAQRRHLRLHHGTVTLIFAAVGVVVQLKEALNVVWE